MVVTYSPEMGKLSHASNDQLRPSVLERVKEFLVIHAVEIAVVAEHLTTYGDM